MYPVIKRAMDICLSLAALLALSPVLVLTAVAVALCLGRPVLFKQVRPGLREQSFVCLKFRTMADRRDAGGALLPDAERITPFGDFLRRASLDELPQFWNVVKGEMSLVGPRPLMTRYLARYNAKQRRRHQVRPGITGWAQVNGRNSIDWPTKLAMDVWYVDNLSLALDLKIIWKTVWIVLGREGVSKAGQVSMEEFLGEAVSQEAHK